MQGEALHSAEGALAARSGNRLVASTSGPKSSEKGPMKDCIAVKRLYREGSTMKTAWFVAVFAGLLLIGSILVHHEGPATIPSHQAFAVHAEAVEAIEGGPVVVKVSLRCLAKPEEGADGYDADVCWSLKDGFPAGWRDSHRVILRIPGMHARACRIAPGQEVSRVRYLHYFHGNIRPGTFRLTIVWTVRSRGVCIATPETTLDLTIAPADEDHLKALCRRLQTRLAKGRDDDQEVRAVIDTMSFTSHRALAPVAWQLLETAHKDKPYDAKRALSLLDGLSDRRQMDERLVCLASGPDLHRSISIFEYWSERKVRLPDDEISKRVWEDDIEAGPPKPAPLSDELLWKLMHSERLWAKVLVYAHFRQRCSQGWIDNLFKDLNNLLTPIPADQFTHLLQEMDSESFVVREKAMAQLANYGERAEAELKQVLQGPLSPEVKRRVRQLLEAIESGKVSPDWKPIIEHLKEMGRGPEADALLGALCKGAPEAALTKAATAAMQERARLYPNER
jgi:hypothetical protein